MMRIALIGSTQYMEKMQEHANELTVEGHTFEFPALDSVAELGPIEICKYNLEMIKSADEVHIFWDQRSMGTIFDFGMVFALRKKVKIVYMEQKTLKNVMESYEKETKNEN